MLNTFLRRFAVWSRRVAAVGAIGCLASSVAFAADSPKNPTPPPRPDSPQTTPRDTKDPRDTARDKDKDARDNKDNRDTPRANKDNRDTPRDNKDNRDTARDNKDNRDTARDNKDNRDTARDNKDNRDTARDNKDNRDPRDSKDPRDAKDNRDNVRDNVREGTKDTVRDVREGVKDARDTVRDVREGVKEGVREGNRDAKTEGKRRSAQEWGLTFGKANDRGVPISKLNSSSVAYKAGLRDSDVIVSVNGHNLRAGDDFERWVYDGPRNERVKVIVWRGGREEVVWLEPTVLYVDDESYADDYRYFGVDVDDRYNDRIVVRKVYPDTPAYASGLRDGDVITTWSGDRIAAPRDFGRIIRRTDPGAVKFEYSRDSKTYPGEAKFTTRATGPAVRQERREERREGTGPGIVPPIRNR